MKPCSVKRALRRIEPDALNRHINHKRDTRRKLVIGTYFDKYMEDNESMAGRPSPRSR